MQLLSILTWELWSFCAGVLGFVNAEPITYALKMLFPGDLGQPAPLYDLPCGENEKGEKTPLVLSR